MISQLVHTPRFRGSALKKDWHEFQHQSRQGKYIEPKLFSGFQNQRVKLTRVKSQLYTSKRPNTRHAERNEAFYRLSNTRMGHTISSNEERFQSCDPKREESVIEFSGSNWHPINKTLSDVNHDPSLDLSASLKADNSQNISNPSQSKLHRSSSVFSASLTKPTKSNAVDQILDQRTKSRFHLDLKKPHRLGESIFRSSSIYEDESATPWNQTSTDDSSKLSRY